ncbi:hypothetical protein F4801DRAFT_275875 [Xylaria longipes]|nr:hypothetical protein F4801DRAFT_275875 [Xylaria longipes]
MIMPANPPSKTVILRRGTIDTRYQLSRPPKPCSQDQSFTHLVIKKINTHQHRDSSPGNIAPALLRHTLPPRCFKSSHSLGTHTRTHTPLYQSHINSSQWRPHQHQLALLLEAPSTRCICTHVETAVQNTPPVVVGIAIRSVGSRSEK